MDDMPKRVAHRPGSASSRIMELMRAYARGLICEEVQYRLKMTHQTCSARFSDLKREGLLVATGEKRITLSGGEADVMALPRFKR